MTELSNSSRLPVAVRPAATSHRPVLERMWLLFRHDMSGINGALPNPDGTYPAERLTLAFTDPTWCAWLMTAGQHPIGFTFVRALDQPVRVINSFFVVKPARRHRLGTTMATEVVRSHPGAWQVAYQDTNHAAASFWPALASSLDPQWRHERRPVPERPDLPADSWVMLHTQ